MKLIEKIGLIFFFKFEFNFSNKNRYVLVGHIKIYDFFST